MLFKTWLRQEQSSWVNWNSRPSGKSKAWLGSPYVPLIHRDVREDGFLNTSLTLCLCFFHHSPFHPPDYTFLLNTGYPTPGRHKRKLKISLLLVFPTPPRHVLVSLCWRFNEGLTEQCRDSSMRLDLSEQGPRTQAASGQGAEADLTRGSAAVKGCKAPQTLVTCASLVLSGVALSSCQRLSFDAASLVKRTVQKRSRRS